MSNSKYQRNVVRQDGHFIPKPPTNTSKAEDKKKEADKPPADKLEVHKWVKAFNSGMFGEYAVEVYDNTNIVRKWNGSHWDVVNDEDGYSIALTWMHKRFKQGTKKQAEGFWNTTASLCRLTKAVPVRNAKEVIIPMRNCYLTVHAGGTITTSKPDPKKGMRFSIPVDFKGPIGGTYTPNPIPENSLFGNYLATSMPDLKMRALIQEMVAMTLVDNRQQKALWNYGDGMNGKGVLTELISNAHSKICTLNLQKLSGDHALEGIPNASLLITDECGKGKWEESVFKSVVSGDPLIINPKNKSAYTHHNTSCWIINTNPPPFFTDSSSGVRRRIIPVFWAAKMTAGTKIEHLAKKIIASEYHHVMDWLLDGLVRLAKRDFKEMDEADYPQSVKDAIEQMSFRGDSMEDWIKSNNVACVENHWTSKEDVYDHYVSHCADVDTNPMEPNSFWRALPQKPGMELVTKQRKKDLGGKRVRTVQICLSAEEVKEAQALNAAVAKQPEVPITTPKRHTEKPAIDHSLVWVEQTPEDIADAQEFARHFH